MSGGQQVAGSGQQAGGGGRHGSGRQATRMVVYTAC